MRATKEIKVRQIVKITINVSEREMDAIKDRFFAEMFRER